MAENRRLSEEQKKRIAEAHRKAAAGKSTSQAKTEPKRSASSNAAKTSAVSKSGGKSTASRSVKTAKVQGKKKTSPKIKQTIRRSVAGVCLASSLIIAAIPGDKSGVASAALRSEIGEAFELVNQYNNGMIGDNTGLSKESYDTDLSNYGDITYSGAPNLSGTSDLWSYSIVNAEKQDDGTFKNAQIRNLFNYYTDKPSIEEVGIICNYNDINTDKDLTIPSVIPTSYDFYTDKEIKNYRHANFDIYEYIVSFKGPNEPVTIKDANTGADTGETMTCAELAYLFPGVKDMMDNYNEDPSSWPNIDQAFYGKNIETDVILKEFCGTKYTRIGSNKLDNGNYILTEVSTSNLSSIANPDDPSENLAEKPELIYVVTCTGAKNLTTMDSNGFCYAATQNVVAIGEGTFKNNNTIDKVTLSNGILYIGDDAFRSSSIKNIGLESVKFIGNNVFDSSSLENVSLSPDTKVIGNEAFKKTKLVSVVVPTSTEQIGFGAYAQCLSLKSVSFDNIKQDCRIGEYAFFDTPQLENVSFPSDYRVSLEKACFALGSTGSGNMMTQFDFPSNLITIPNTAKKYELYGANVDLSKSPAVVTDLNGNSLEDSPGVYSSSSVAAHADDMKYTSRLGDYILANRDTLGTVNMHVIGSGETEERIPMNTFANCKSIKVLNFDEGQTMAVYDANLLRSSAATELCVNGPSTSKYSTSSDGSKYAWPRKSTWNAYSGASDYVPYCYGDDHYEVGYDGFLYDLSVANKLDDTSDATITAITYLGDPDNLSDVLGKYDSLDNPFSLPDKVAKHPVRGLKDGCLSNIKDEIIYFEIPDDTIKTVDKNVFANAAKLKGVILGNSVETVADGAFANATKLEDVYWSNNGNVSYIDEAAFRTNSDKLYFHTLADVTSTPFSYAMGDAVINDNGTGICVVTPSGQDYSEGLKIMRDKNTNEITLIDYLHFYDPELSDATYGNLMKKAEAENLTQEEQSLYDACKDLRLPQLIESIDSVKYIGEDSPSNKNRKNWVYLNDEAGTSGHTKRELYSTYTGPDGKSHPGLFSAYTVDTTGLISGEEEENLTGNDCITSIEMPGVTSIPDYCFDSCEQLLTAKTGEGCEKIGDGAFQDCADLQSLIIGDNVDEIGDNIIAGCKSLPINGLSTSNNPKFLADNGILYEKTSDDPTYDIVTCVPSREQDVISSFDSKLPQVESIRPGAFKDCSNIDRVDLTDSLIDTIPSHAFDGCTGLADVYLPESVTSIEDDAFANGSGNVLNVDIPARQILIGSHAFDPDYKKVRFTTYKDSQAVDYADKYPPKQPDIEVTLKGEEYRVIFENDDGSTFDEQKVLPGGTVTVPDQTPEPIEPDHEGYVFDAWVLKEPSDISGNNIYNNVNEDRIYRATFKKIDYTYTVTFKNDDYSVLKVFTDVPHGTYIHYDEIPVSTKTPNRAFKGWDFDPNTFTMSSKVTSDVVAYASYSPYDIPEGKHLVTFFEDDNQTEFTHYYITDGDPLWDPGHPTKSLRHPDQGYTFDMWMFEPNNYKIGVSVSENVFAYANFERLSPTSKSGSPTPTSSGNQASATPTPKGGSASGNSASSNETGYLVTVENGAGTARHKAGEVVTITAYAATEGKVFDRWTTSNADIGFSNAYAVATTFVMPTHDVKVTATYKSANATPTASGNAAKATTTPAPGGNSSSGGNNNNGGGSASGNSSKGSAVAGETTGNNGTEVRITSDTIDNNKKNMGTASVAGSTDNFVVKVTDSAAASAAVEQALRNAYGSDFPNLKYVAFDISLYDSTGTVPVANANNLAVTITLPIPDQLVSYAGNNKAAAIANGAIEPLAVQYTTIDGVPCMRFTATHFSPYTIYVDTQNIVRGVADVTPKTGDGIAPKWFLSAGMLSLSCVLFLWKDKKVLADAGKKKK